MKERTTIRPECLRPAHDFWVHPEPDEVREVLRLAGLSGAKAARLLGLGSGDTGSRTVRRYTGGEANIPYASWAILCEAAGLGCIWREAGDRPSTGIEKPTAERMATQLEAFGAAEEIVRATWAGERTATVTAIAECRDALVRMRQITHALEVSSASSDLLDRLRQRIADAHDKLKVILGWVEMD